MRDAATPWAGTDSNAAVVRNRTASDACAVTDGLVQSTTNVFARSQTGALLPIDALQRIVNRNRVQTSACALADGFAYTVQEPALITSGISMHIIPLGSGNIDSRYPNAYGDMLYIADGAAMSDDAVSSVWSASGLDKNLHIGHDPDGDIDSTYVYTPPVNYAPLWADAPSTLAFTQGLGGTYAFGPFASDPDADTLTFSLVGTSYSGIYIDPTTGVLNVTASAAAAVRALTLRVADPDGLYADWLVTVTIATAPTGALIAGDDWDTFPLGPLADGYSYLKFGGTIRHSLSGYATGTGVASPWASVCVTSPRYGASGRAFTFYIPGNTSGGGEFRCQHELSNFEGYPSTVIEGREVWAGFAIRLDAAFPYPSEGYPFFFGAHAAVGQYDGSPWGIRFLRTGSTQWRFNMEQAGTGTYGVDLGDYSADRGQWVRWVIHMKYSLIGQGWAKVWKNGIQVVNQLNISTLHPTCTQTPFIKWGIYNDRMRYYNSVDERTTLDAIRIAGSGGSLALIDPITYGGS